MDWGYNCTPSQGKRHLRSFLGGDHSADHLLSAFVWASSPDGNDYWQYLWHVLEYNRKEDWAAPTQEHLDKLLIYLLVED